MVALHDIVELEPVLIDDGDTPIVTTGTAITVKLLDTVAPAPAELLQNRVKVKVPATFIILVLAEPLLPCEPVHPPVPPAVHELGLLVALQVITAVEPVPIEAGDTVKVTTGGTVGATPLLTLTPVDAVVVPPALVQLRLYV